MIVAGSQGLNYATDVGMQQFIHMQHFDDMADQLQRDEFTDGQREFAGRMALGFKLLNDRKLSFTWRVP